jgi:hypothetical protein
MDNNKFTEIPADFCKQPLPGAYKNSGGCNTDWPAQPFDTCCVYGNRFTLQPAPACLSNCVGTIVSTWNDLSTFIAKLTKGDSALYILSKGFSTPQSAFNAIRIASGISVIIDGGGYAHLHGRGTSRMFIVNEGAPLIIKGVTLHKGYAEGGGGAVYVHGGSATFSSCSFVKNTATGNDYGGGAVLMEGGSVTFSSCSFVKNTATGDFGGGAVAVYGEGSARIFNCSFKADGYLNGSGTDSKYNGISNDGGKVTFGCPTGTAGADVPMPGSELGTLQLPPAKQIVSCH